MVKTAIMIDGAFYRKRAYYFWGDIDPVDRAQELYRYCQRHIKEETAGAELYRVFYYDCPPSSKKIYHPLTKSAIDLSKTAQYRWSIEFLGELKRLRKFALRLGRLAEEQAYFNLNPLVTRKLLNGSMRIEDLKESDFNLEIKQKGVDMRIGVDIASVTFKNRLTESS